MRAERIREGINRLARQRRPFLFAVDFEMTSGIVIEQPERQHDVLFRTPLGTNAPGRVALPKVPDPMTCRPEPFEVYAERFRVVSGALHRGDSFLTNLTVRTPIDTPFSLEEIFRASSAPYTLCVPGEFVCFSPERFVRISGGVISTNPMKGTIGADIPDAESVILSDPKESAEHNTIVDLLRNDLGMVAADVAVNRFRYIDRIRTGQGDILQVSSEITGTLEGDYLTRLGDIIFAMLPAGSVSGAPKQSTLEAIRRAEREPRGYYTGVFGYFDGRELDSAVMIRFIEQRGALKYFRSGGGITVWSDARSEYDEVRQKIYLPFV